MNCTEGEIRLYGSSKSNEGTLHICINEAWGAVCMNAQWSNSETNVACKELGYSIYGIYKICLLPHEYNLHLSIFRQYF